MKMLNYHPSTDRSRCARLNLKIDPSPLFLYQLVAVHCCAWASSIDFQRDRSDATCIQRRLAVMTKSSVYLAVTRCTFLSHRLCPLQYFCAPSAVRFWQPAQCHFSLLIRWAMSTPFVLLRISSFVDQPVWLLQFSHELFIYPKINLRNSVPGT